MTDNQISIARHALGLGHGRALSYRNAFVCGAGSKDHADWLLLVDGGFATMRDGKTVPYGGDDIFRLTRKGADAVLKVGESLDPEDLPSTPL